MDRLFINRVTAFFRTQKYQIQRMMEFAPGAVAVHDTFGDKGGEYDLFFDLKRWAPKDPQLWGENGLIPPDFEGTGMGVLPGVVNGRDFNYLFHYAKHVLQPLQPGLDWHQEPLPILFSALIVH